MSRFTFANLRNWFGNFVAATFTSEEAQQKPYDINKVLHAFVLQTSSPYPKEDPRRIRRVVAAGQVDIALERALEILRELDAIKPDFDQFDLVGAAQFAANTVAERHPDMDRDGIATLARCYAWWYK